MKTKPTGKPVGAHPLEGRRRHYELMIDPRYDRRTGDLRKLTGKNLEMLKARFRYGSRKASAMALGMSEMSLRHHYSRICQILNVDTVEQAVYVLWLRELWGDTLDTMKPPP